MIKFTINLCTLIILLMLTSISFGGILDGYDDLEGMLIVHAGEVEKLDCPIAGNYDCMTWPLNLYKFESKAVCFKMDSIFGCTGLFCRGFIAIGNDKTPYFVQLNNTGTGVTKSLVTLYKCPNIY